MQWFSQNWWWILLAVGVLFFLRRRAAGGGMGGGMGCGMGGRHSSPEERHVHEDGPERDPVNGHPVDRAHALSTIFDGRTYYFETEESRSEFNSDPQRFAATHIHHRHGGC
ncbi:hypothetical protein C0Z18_12495 [Trinickia dabaoshanensis]|uniref:YHS domain-containing protein n=1 Tax=Trinickia dabaoshanensis TaxID=564714 RepID=A0A2N7VR79_9BURK|nr:YHS domain-containing protein [Trinickia dabaoshanensis]PMS19664.1 hypothetical protein C0Z18_12495 [Trinickia dabaoshanensis]TAM50885.1 MAG: YHS domain-containing protein [Paraburkholderia sp.]